MADAQTVRKWIAHFFREDAEMSVGKVKAGPMRCAGGTFEGISAELNIAGRKCLVVMDQQLVTLGGQGFVQREVMCHVRGQV